MPGESAQTASSVGSRTADHHPLRVGDAERATAAMLELCTAARGGSSFQNMQPCHSPVGKFNDCALHVAVAPCEAVGPAERNPVRGDLLAWEPPSWEAL